MRTQKPYLIRAIHEWCSDNELTPYLVVLVNANTIVPLHLVKDNTIVLNTSKTATRDLSIGLDEIQFKATFSGEIVDIYVPIENVVSILAKENSQGLNFDIDKTALLAKTKETKSSGLKLVK